MQTVPEIHIRGFITWDLPPGGLLETHGGTLPESKVCRGRSVVEAIDAARVAGARVLVVTIDSVGGGMEASSAIYRALRRFSDEAHGTVITHVVGLAASSASTIALAGDLVFLAGDARFIVHGAVAFKAGGEPARVIAEANTAMLAIYVARTRTPLEDLEEWLRYEYDPAADRYHCAELRADAARALRWADGTATADEVRALAAEIAAGRCSYTPRRLALLERAGGAEAAIVTDKLAANAVTAAKIAAGTITAEKLAANAITAAKIAAGELKTSNYAEDAGGYPTAGAKLDHTGTALKVAPANLQIGKTVVRDAWFGKATLITFRNAGINSLGAFFFDAVHGVPGTVINFSGGNGTNSSRLYIRLNGFAAAGYTAAYLVGCPPTAGGYTLRDSGFRTVGSELYLDLDLCRWEDAGGAQFTDVMWSVAGYPTTLKFTIAVCITDANGSNF